MKMSKYEAALSRTLSGHKIVDVQFSDDFPILILDNGVCVVIQQDDEGNGPGAMSLQKIDGTPVDIWGGK
jgi:hypothetical protein